MKKTLIVYLLAGFAAAHAANEVIVPLGADWHFFATGEAAAANWKIAGFDDSGWMNGIAKIGTGHGDHATRLPPIVAPRMTVYFRRQFTLPLSPSENTALLARMVCDAGAVVYLNGVEAGRVGMPAGAVAAAKPASAEPLFPQEGSLRAVPYAATDFLGHGIGQPKHDEPRVQYQPVTHSRKPSGPACGGAGRA